jgi:hypothetical protein
MPCIPTFRTSFGPRQLPSSPMVRVSLTRREVDALIRLLGRNAVQAERSGRFSEADNLALCAAILRGAL